MLFQNLYGDDVVNATLRIIFEFLFYFLGSALGAAIRNCSIKKSNNLAEILGFSLLISVAMIVIGTKLSELKDPRLVFGIAVFAGIYTPNFGKTLKNGNLFKAIIGILSHKARDFVEDLEGKGKN